MSPRGSLEGAQLGDGYPCAHSSLRSGLLCLSAASNTLPLLVCKAFGCFMFSFRGTIQQVPVRGLDCVSPKHVLAVPETPTVILSLDRAPQISRLAALQS